MVGKSAALRLPLGIQISEEHTLSLLLRDRHDNIPIVFLLSKVLAGCWRIGYTQLECVLLVVPNQLYFSGIFRDL